VILSHPGLFAPTDGGIFLDTETLETPKLLPIKR
jgi:hypothetical protein